MFKHAQRKHSFLKRLPSLQLFNNLLQIKKVLSAVLFQTHVYRIEYKSTNTLQCVNNNLLYVESDASIRPRNGWIDNYNNQCQLKSLLKNIIVGAY
jgi:hypothetical protein